MLQLRDKGKLNLDDPAEKYLPEISKIKQISYLNNEEKRLITLR